MTEQATKHHDGFGDNGLLEPYGYIQEALQNEAMILTQNNPVHHFCILSASDNLRQPRTDETECEK
jgi:hypothetical protein